ncbi:MAG: HAMP domain-containing sensor histidine kinase [Chloroflexota bacterium]
MTRRQILWQAPPWQGILEALILGVLILFLLNRIQGDIPQAVYTNGMLFLCGVTGLWAVFRIRLPAGSTLHQILWETGVGMALGLTMAGGLYAVGQLTGWASVWQSSTLIGAVTIGVLLFGIGIGYLPARLGVRFWLLWRQARQRKFRFELTHMLLMTVVLAVAAVILFSINLNLFFQPDRLFPDSARDLFTSISVFWLHTVFPALNLVALVVIVLGLVLLPPALLFSYFAARRTTKRLEQLTTVASALQAGDYDVRVPVEGEDEVAQLQITFNQMADELGYTLADLQTERNRVSNLLETQRHLVANVSHELRTPVATARAMLESSFDRWEEDGLPPGLRNDLQVLDGEIKRLQRLIDDLFTLSRLEAGGLSLECQPLDITPTINRLTAAMAPYAWETGKVELTAEIPDALPPISVDEARFEQVLSNLLRNGLFHTPPGGIVMVVADPAPDALHIHVRDTGEGIPPGDLPHIWDRFYQGQTSRPQVGSGLGLAVVKDLTTAMNGTIRVESNPGRGSCFTLSFPYS